MIFHENWINNFVTLLVILDPPGLIPIFLGLTVGMNQKERSQAAYISSIIAFGILILFFLIGIHLLNILGISLDAFRIAGGILLFCIAFEMIFEKIKDQRKEKNGNFTSTHIKNISAFPLALPLIAGPGTISATILMASSQKNILDIIATTVVIVLSITVCYFCMLLASPIEKLMGDTGRSIFTRLFGVLLAALSVQFITDSLKNIFL